MLEPRDYSCQICDTTNWKKDFFTIKPDEAYNHSYFHKGHLTPKCDFYSGAEKRMTFYYVNSSPQVPDFNKKNWRDLEGVLRTNAARANKKLVIYTGTTQSIGYLNEIPIQLYFWKVVIEPISGEGIAFVGVNNVKKIVNNPCGINNCGSITWLSRAFKDRITILTKGLIYCCTVQEFKKIPNIQLPDLIEFRGGDLIRM